MWYYKIIPSMLNLHKIFFYLLTSFIQARSKKTYTKYKFIYNKKNTLEDNYFLRNIQICEKKSQKCDCLLLMDKFNFLQIIRNLRYLNRIRIYDMDYFGHFGLTMILKIQYFDFTSIKIRSGYLKNSFENLEILKKSSLNKSINLLGNNSEYSEKKDKIIGNHVMICNDAIADEEFIKQNEVILAVADPLFFFSEADYSINFLQNLKKVESIINFLVIPTVAIPIIKKLNISTPVIGINSSRFQKEIYQIKDGQLISMKTHNIFTQYMLPLAMYLNTETFIGGFTLKNNKSNFKLWSYDENVVEKNSKNFAFKFSFFQHRNFQKYYRSHYAYIKKILDNNKNIYEL